MVNKLLRKWGPFLITLLFSYSAIALSVLPTNIEDLSQFASKIVYGKVVSVDPHPGVNGNPAYLAVKVQVFETLKGKKESVYEFHQPTNLDTQKKGMFSDLPKYTPGETVVLFLTQPSDINLSTPIGLGQGIFKVLGKEGGADPQLRNENKNKSLFQNLKLVKTKTTLRNMQMGEAPTTLKLSQLRELVKQAQGTP